MPIVNASTEDLNAIDSVQYVFIYDNNEAIQDWGNENYPNQTGNSVIIRE